jgi:hypothetical protein
MILGWKQAGLLLQQTSSAVTQLPCAGCGTLPKCAWSLLCVLCSCQGHKEGPQQATEAVPQDCP